MLRRAIARTHHPLPEREKIRRKDDASDDECRYSIGVHEAPRARSDQRHGGLYRGGSGAGPHLVSGQVANGTNGPNGTRGTYHRDRRGRMYTLTCSIAWASAHGG